MRRIATDPKTGFTGVVLVASFAMFSPVMAISNAGTTLPLPFCRWGLSVMVEMRGEHEEVVRRDGSEEGPIECGRPSRRSAPHQFDQSGYENNHIATAAMAVSDRHTKPLLPTFRSRDLEK